MMQSEYERTEKDQVYAQTHVVGKPTKKEVLGRAWSSFPNSKSCRKWISIDRL
jgi:hypothetical protein